MSTKPDSSIPAGTPVPAVTYKHKPKQIKSLDCLLALANVVVASSLVVISEDKLDATVTIGYIAKETGEIETVEVSMNLLDSAYVGIVKLWPMMKQTKDEVRLAQSTARNAEKNAASEAKKAEAQAAKDKRAEERTAAKAKREEEQAAAKAKRTEELAAKAKAKEEELAAKKKAKEDAATAKAAEKAAAAAAKQEADTAKAAAAAAKVVAPTGALTKAAQGAVHTAGTKPTPAPAKPTPPKSAASKAVAAIQGGARMTDKRK